jgi:hypothetical protein
MAGSLVTIPAILTFIALLFASGFAMAQTQSPEQKIWSLLDDSKSVYVSLAEADFRAGGEGFDLPDGGRSVSALAAKAPGGAFDPRDAAKIPAQELGYKTDWVVERFRRYNLDWDITGLRLTSLDPQAKNYPWFIIINGGAANFYEFYVDLKNRPGWAQYLAQKLNVMIVTIPGNFRYGGWNLPNADRERQPAYLLDHDLSADEYNVRNAIFTNALIMQGLKALVQNNTTGDILLIGHSTSGELSMMAYQDPDLAPRLKGRYLGWGSGGPARLELLRTVRGKEVANRAGASPPGGKTPIEELERRDPSSYARGYSGFLNPLYEPGMSHLQIAEKWLAAEGRRRPNFKQQLQNLEHGTDLGQKAWVEDQIERLLKKTGNPWRIAFEDVARDLFVTNFTRMDGFKRMVWTTAHFDRNHWNPEDPMKAIEVFVANEYRAKNPNAEIRLINWDPPMTHYGHLEMPRELAGAEFAVVKWLVRPE